MSPVTVLLAGLSVAALLIGAGWQWSRVVAERGGVSAAGPGDETPDVGLTRVPEPAPSSPPAGGGQASPDRERVAGRPLTGAWAGPVGRATLAVAAKDGTAIAYLCDGDKLEVWLKGTATDGRLNLTGKNGARLTGTVNAARAEGTVVVPGGSFRFAIDKAVKPSGLYRFANSVRGATIVGGWIVLGDGRQVGLATVDGSLVKPSALDLVDRTATVGGTTVTAVPAEDSPS